MKIKPAQADRFVAAPDPATRAVLLYGPNGGLVRERAERLVRAVAEDPADPFRVTEIPAAELDADPARLADEAASLSLTGGRRVIRVRGVQDGATRHFERLLAETPGEALVVVEADALGARSPLRRLFESAANAAAVACYEDDGRSLDGVIRAFLAERGLDADPEALAYLQARLGADRQVTRGELEKLALYMGSATRVGLAEATAAIGDSAPMTLDEVAFAMADGDLRGLGRALDRAYAAGLAPVAVLRSAQSHVQRLHLAASRVAAGETPAEAMRKLRPPPFWKVEARFRRQLGWWTPALLARALDRLTEAELLCKTTGVPDAAAAAQALLGIAGAALRSRRAGAG